MSKRKRAPRLAADDEQGELGMDRVARLGGRRKGLDLLNAAGCSRFPRPEKRYREAPSAAGHLRASAASGQCRNKGRRQADHGTVDRAEGLSLPGHDKCLKSQQQGRCRADLSTRSHGLLCVILWTQAAAKYSAQYFVAVNKLVGACSGSAAAPDRRPLQSHPGYLSLVTVKSP